MAFLGLNIHCNLSSWKKLHFLGLNCNFVDLSSRGKNSMEEEGNTLPTLYCIPNLTNLGLI